MALEAKYPRRLFGGLSAAAFMLKKEIVSQICITK